MKKLIILLFLPAAFGLIFGGCSSSTNPEAEPEDFSPYTASDEQPSFADPLVLEVMSDSLELELDVPAELTPLFDSLDEEDQTLIYSFRMVWGNLERDTNVTELTDWSGTLTLSRGAVRVTHTILFEEGQDYLLPRYDSAGFYIPEQLGWVSQTAGHVDGIATRIYIPPSVTDDIVTVTFETDQLTQTFAVSELDDLDTLISIGIGNAVSFQSVRFERPDFRPTRGHLAGRWGVDDEGNGIFYGRWMSTKGRLMGALKGRWGIDENGNNYFVGKYIDRDGNFEGFIKGIWRDRGRGRNAAGQFHGRIFNADRQPIGVLKGHFKKGDNPRGGYFAGKWCVGRNCFSLGWQ